MIENFGLEDEGLTPEEIVEKLDVFYNPEDDPLAIKMDSSIERGVNGVIKEMLK